MINAVEISHFRGIADGSVEELGPISVLVGPNGCGKSTVLEAILIAASGSPGDAVGRVVKRRVELLNGARWIFFRGRGEGGGAPSVRVIGDAYSRGATSDRSRRVTLTFDPEADRDHEAQLVRRGARDPFAMIRAEVVAGSEQLDSFSTIASDGTYVFDHRGSEELRRVPLTRLIETPPGAVHSPLDRVYSKAVEAGRLGDVERLAASVVQGLDRILMLTDEGSAPVVHLAFADHSIPAAVAGDGILGLLRLAFELGLPSGSTALIEEPEAHQHARSMHLSAQTIVAAARRGVQVILSTHSLELLDDLLQVLGEKDVGLLSVHRLYEKQGRHRTVVFPGEQAAFARESIGEDLR